MNFPTFIVAAVVFLIVGIQHSNADPTLVIRNGFENAINLVQKAEDMALKQLSVAENQVQTQSTEAKETIQQGILEAGKLLYTAGISVFQSLGRTLALTNDKAKNELQQASILIQKVGYGAIVAVKGTASLTDQGIDARGEKTKQALKTVRETIKAAIQAVLNALKISQEYAMKAIEDAQSNSIKLEVPKSVNAKMSHQDQEASEYIRKIDEAAEDCIDRDGDADIINDLREALISAIRNISKATNDEKQIIQNIQNPSTIQPSAAITLFSKQSDAIKEDIHNAVSNIFLALGFAGEKSDNQSSDKIGLAITTVDQAKVDFFYELESAEALAIFGLKYQVNSPGIGIDTALDALRYCKLVFLQKVVDAAKIAFDVL